ncbi:T6SS effector BTH_I2691 family protein [Pseudomonas sp. HLMP]|uniref:T6SS effector BTH_I2691 family protein n=1 Tax=Pseudomonas sp. HLMP TaxID=3153767 RepID=UPI003966CADF
MPTDSSTVSTLSGPACSARIPILPIRYAVVPKARDAAHLRYADSGFRLEHDFAPLQHCAYTLRSLRAGYIYVFMKGPLGEKLVIHEYDGAGLYRELTYKGLEDYQRRDRYTTGKSIGWVWADTCKDTAREVWIGYSSHLWSNAMSAQVMTSVASRKRHMRALNISELISGERTASSQAHVLPIRALQDWVEDFKPNALRMDLRWSSHPCPETLHVANLAGIVRHYPYAQPRVPAVVALNDAEGISLDLGLSANAYRHALSDVSAREHPARSIHAQTRESIPACYQLDVGRICQQSQEFHHKSLVAMLLERTLETLYPPSAPDLIQATRVQAEQHERATGSPQPPGLTRYNVLTNERHSPLGARLAQRIDRARYEAFINEREIQESKLRDLQRQALIASADHDTWLATAENAHIDDPKSLAAAIASYDRDNALSARGLEVTLALMLNSMSQPSPGTEEQDLRFKRLEKWLDQHDSPLYLALAPFNPLNDKPDAAGTLIGASDSTIEVVAGRFPAVADVTDLTAQAVNTVVLKRLKGKTRWNASSSFSQRIIAAAQEANAEKALGLLKARYRITDQTLRQSSLSQAVTQYLESGMAQVEEMKQLRISGSRTVTLEMTTTQYVKPKIAAILRSLAGAGLNAGVLWFNLINLKVAYANVQKSSAPEYTTGFASAIAGVIGAASATLITTRSAQTAVMARLGSILPGSAFGNGLAQAASSNLFARAAGYPGIILGLASDILKARRQSQNGDEIAYRLTVAAGFSAAIGSAMILEGTLAIAGPTFLIPFAGWKAAFIVLVGASVLAAGLALHAKATERLHTPMELWAARSAFGTRLNDGEERSELSLDASKKLPAFKTLSEELENWHAAYYTPIRISHQDTKQFGINGLDSSIHSHTVWAHPDWGTIIQTGPTETVSYGEITVLLRGFVLGQSRWSAHLRYYNSFSNTAERLSVQPTCHLIPGGLILHFKADIPQGSVLSLDIDYFPNQGITEKSKARAKIVVRAHE